MSARNNTFVKTFNNNNNNNKSFNKSYNNNNNKHQFNNAKPVPTLSKNNQSHPQQAHQKKKNNHRYQQQQHQDDKLQATTAKNGRRRNNKKKNFDNMTAASPSEDNTSTSSTSSSEEEDGPLTPPVTPTHLLEPTAKQPHYPKAVKSLGDQVYAGPTFNNAPAPSAIPIPPTFGNANSPRGSPTHNAMTIAPGRPMLNYSPSASPSAAPVAFAYPQQQHYMPYPLPHYSMMPTPQPPQHKVVTAFELEQTNLALSEIQRDLRSMLRIQS